MTLLLAFVLFGFSHQGSRAEPADSGKLWQAQHDLFVAVAGHWECTGAFSDGRPVAADLTFTLQPDTRMLDFVHRDRAPNQFIGHWLWGTDQKNNQIVSLGFVGTQTVQLPAFLVGRSWTSRSLTLEAQTLASPLSAPNRFTYSIDGASLNVLWEVQRDGVYTVGDRLKCKRA